MSPAYAVEALKLRRSRVVLVATLVLALVPAAMARGFLAAAEQGGNDPASLKAQAMLPGVGWTGYLGGLMQVYATAGVLGVGIVVGWCFGREYADRTLVSLYASATPRDAVAGAKLVLLTVWARRGRPRRGARHLAARARDRARDARRRRLADSGAGGGAGRVVGPARAPGGGVASMGRGYLPAVGGLLVLVVLAQVATIAGAGGWWPWSVPAVWAMGPEAGMPAVAAARLLVVPAVTLAGAVVTVRWWRHAEVV